MKNKLIESPINQLMEKMETFTFIDLPVNKEFVQTYREKYGLIINDLTELGKLETLILQINASQFNIDDIILFPVLINKNTYINARVGFYRPQTKSQTIRVVLGNVKDIGSDLDLIKQNHELMYNVHQNLLGKMKNEINKTKKSLKI
jgi:hypothetical protein